MKSEFNIVDKINERLSVCLYKGRRLVVENKRLEEDGLVYIDGLYKIQYSLSKRLERGKKAQDRYRNSLSEKERKRYDKSIQAIQDRWNDEAKTNAFLSGADISQEQP